MKKQRHDLALLDFGSIGVSIYQSSDFGGFFEKFV